jgi:hypothetical protein
VLVSFVSLVVAKTVCSSQMTSFPFAAFRGSALCALNS